MQRINEMCNSTLQKKDYTKRQPDKMKMHYGTARKQGSFPKLFQINVFICNTT